MEGGGRDREGEEQYKASVLLLVEKKTFLCCICNTGGHT